jgi:hypothetical protein
MRRPLRKIDAFKRKKEEESRAELERLEAEAQAEAQAELDRRDAREAGSSDHRARIERGYSTKKGLIAMKKTTIQEISAKIMQLIAKNERGGVSAAEQDRVMDEVLAWKTVVDKIEKEVEKLETPVNVDMWQSNRADIEKWIKEWRLRGARALEGDKTLRDIIDRRSALVSKKLVGSIPQEMNEVQKQIDKLDDDIKEFKFIFSEVAGQIDLPVIQAPDSIQAPVSEVMERFYELIGIRNEHMNIQDKEQLRKFDDAAKSLKNILVEHLLEVQVACNKRFGVEDSGHSNLLTRLKAAARQARAEAEEEANTEEVARNEKVIASVHSAMERKKTMINLKLGEYDGIVAKMKELADVGERSTNVKERQKAIFDLMLWKDRGAKVQMELKDLQDETYAEVWQADRQDIKKWIAEYRRRGIRAKTQDGELRDMIKKKNQLVTARNNTMINQHKSERHGAIAIQMLQSLSAEIRSLEQEIAEFGRTGAAAGGDGRRVLVAPDSIQRPVTRVLERFANLLETRKKLQDADAEELQKLDTSARDLSQLLSVHLKGVEASCNMFEDQEAAEAGATDARSAFAKLDLREEKAPPPVRRRGAVWNYADTASAAYGGVVDMQHLAKMKGLLDGRRVVTVHEMLENTDIEKIHRITLDMDKSLAAQIEAIVPFYDWRSVTSMSGLNIETLRDLNWKKTWVPGLDEQDSREQIDDWGNRVLAIRPSGYAAKTMNYHLFLVCMSRGGSN